MDSNKLTYFVTVATELSFSRAAERLFISQQALSKCISGLENELGAKLFERRPRVMLTKAGHLLLDAAQKILTTEYEFMFALRRSQDESSLRVGLGGRMREAFFLQGIVSEFRKKNPGITLQIVYEASVEKVESMLMRGELDMRIGYISPDKKKYFCAYVLREDSLYMIVPKSFLKLHTVNRNSDGSVNVSDFADMPFVLFPKDTGYRHLIAEFEERTNIRFHPVLESDSNEAMLLMASQGIGITFASDGTIQSYKKFSPQIFDNVEIFSIGDMCIKNNLALIYPNGYTLSPAAESFIQICDAMLY